MLLNDITLESQREQLLALGYKLPEYNRAAMRARTLAAPTWVHFGAGNIFRAFIAAEYDGVLATGEYSGIVAVETFDEEIIQSAYAPYDCLNIAVQLRADGSVQKQVVGSVAQAVAFDAQGIARLRGAFHAPGLQIASFTVTEKGYRLADAQGKVFPTIGQDFDAGPAKAQTLLGIVTGLLYTRYTAGLGPIALLSLDNCSHNGSLLQAAVARFAQEWHKRSYVGQAFVDYVQHEVQYPWSVIDKITPAPDAKVHTMLARDGWQSIAPFTTAKGARTAAYVNAEVTGYLVVEDSFPNGRPPLEKAGFLFASREVVDRFERMKVCTCLNPLHTALAIFGCLLGYNSIYAEMQDRSLRQLLRRLGYIEGLPVVSDPGILSPTQFLDTVLTQRLPNPYIPDTPQRIAADTSQKLAIRFGCTVHAYLAYEKLNPKDLQAIPLVFAAWCRYLLCLDDNGHPFQPSPDPLLPDLLPLFKQESLTAAAPSLPLVFLQNSDIWGVDLVASGLQNRVEEYYTKMCQRPGAVRSLLDNLYAGDQCAEANCL